MNFVDSTSPHHIDLIHHIWQRYSEPYVTLRWLLWLPGAFLPKINLFEIGAVGTTLDSAKIARTTSAALLVNQQTGKFKSKTPALVQRFFWSGGYVDEVVSYTVKSHRRRRYGILCMRMICIRRMPSPTPPHKL